MKRIVLLALVFGMVLSVGNVWAYPSLSVGDVINYESQIGNANSGGAFWIYKTASPSDKLSTFCIEKDEYLYNGETIFNISNIVIQGGSDSNSSPALSYGAAYLYNKWLNTVSSPTAEVANAYQAAIWKYEGEISDYSYLDAATASLAVQLYADALNANGYYGVEVLNLKYWEDGCWKNGQSLLYQAVPEPATMMLLGFGLFGLAAYGRKKFA